MAGCAVTGPACPVGAVAGAVIGAAAGVAIYYGGRYLYQHAIKSEASPPLPKDIVGTQDAKSGRQRKRHNSGPLAPEHGGTGDAEKDFGKLTAGESAPAPAGKNYRPGTRVGSNGILHRPATPEEGPRIDIPANGSKPHETLHYLKPPPPPPELKDEAE